MPAVDAQANEASGTQEPRARLGDGVREVLTVHQSRALCFSRREVDVFSQVFPQHGEYSIEPM